MKNQYKKKRVFEIIQIGSTGDFLSIGFDILVTIMIVSNIIIAVLDTFKISAQLSMVLDTVELISVVFFTIEYALRVWTAECLYPGKKRRKAVLSYIFSFVGIVDFLSFFPYYLPFVVPSGMVAFRIFRVVRIFRLFRINAYYDSLNVIVDVLKSKKQQLLSSVFIILVLMLSASLCMYSLEHEAQPEVFANAFSGLWWSVSTLLTVGYGDIYPVTLLGRVFGIVITFLGVGMVAIPTGILSAGFVEQYSKLKALHQYSRESNLSFIKLLITDHHTWENKLVQELALPQGMILTVIQRGEDILVPRGNVRLLEGDQVVIGAEAFAGGHDIELKEIELQKHHPWNGSKIKNLDISRRTIVVMVQRKGRVMIPNGELQLLEGDHVLLYTQKYVKDAEKFIV